MHVDFFFKHMITAVLIESSNNLNFKGSPKAFYSFKKERIVNEFARVNIINRDVWEQSGYEDKIKLLGQYKFKLEKGAVF